MHNNETLILELDVDFQSVGSLINTASNPNTLTVQAAEAQLPMAWKLRDLETTDDGSEAELIEYAWAA